jgi:hypothetical protein
MDHFLCALLHGEGSVEPNFYRRLAQMPALRGLEYATVNQESRFQLPEYNAIYAAVSSQEVLSYGPFLLSAIEWIFVDR